VRFFLYTCPELAEQPPCHHREIFFVHV
jgi:hypothetical protein